MTSSVSVTGMVLFSDIRRVFGGSNMVLASDYYENSQKQYTPAVSGIPAIGNLMWFGAFRGKPMQGVARRFTNAFVDGPNGPTLAQVQSAHAGVSRMAGVSLFNSIIGFQTFTVPRSATYAFEVAGANGGLPWVPRAGDVPGRGGVLTFTCALKANDGIIIAVGQSVPAHAFGHTGVDGGGAGGGGTFVVRLRDGQQLLLAVAGGGGGQASARSPASGRNADVLQTEPTQSVLTSTQYSTGASYAASVPSTPPGSRGWSHGLVGGQMDVDVGQGAFGGGGYGGFWGWGGGGGGYNGGSAEVTGDGGFAGTNYHASVITDCVASLQPLSAVHGYVTVLAFPMTFTPCGALGVFGPTSAQVSVSGNTMYQGTRGYQLFTAPTARTYTITCYGAAGGAYNERPGGRGGVVSASFPLSANQQIVIVVGQRGDNGSHANAVCGGGGGGTFVVEASTSTCLICAGGGGGSGTIAAADAISLTPFGASPSITDPYNLTRYQAGAAFNVSSTAGTPGSGGVASSAGNYTNGFAGSGGILGIGITSGVGGFGGGGGAGNPFGSGAGGGGGGYIGGVGDRTSTGGTSFVNTSAGSSVVFSGDTNMGNGYVVVL